MKSGIVFLVLASAISLTTSASVPSMNDNNDPLETDYNTSDLPLELQTMIKSLSVTTAGCWLRHSFRGLGVAPNVCPDASYPELFLDKCYQKCAEGMITEGPWCWSGLNSMQRDSVFASCPSELPLESKGLCYKPCPQSFKPVGPMCLYSQCPTTHPFQCGMGCTDNGFACAKVLLEYARLGFKALKAFVKRDWENLPMSLKEIVATVMAWKSCADA